MHHGPCRHALFQQLSGDGAADLAVAPVTNTRLLIAISLSNRSQLISRHLFRALPGRKSQATTIAAPSAMPAHTSEPTCRPSRKARSTASRTWPACWAGSCPITLCAKAIECRIALGGQPGQRGRAEMSRVHRREDAARDGDAEGAAEFTRGVVDGRADPGLVGRQRSHDRLGGRRRRQAEAAAEQQHLHCDLAVGRGRVRRGRPRQAGGEHGQAAGDDGGGADPFDQPGPQDAGQRDRDGDRQQAHPGSEMRV